VDKAVPLSVLKDRLDERRDRGEPATPEDVCADCPDMLQPLRQHLDAVEKMKKAVGLESKGEPATVPDEPPPVLPGYEILGELGHGGMGVVYRARKVDSHVEREVALKLIRYGGSTPRRRFRTEAQALARLQHPNVVQVFDDGEHDGQRYLAMELCPGSLAERLRGGPLDVREAARVAEAVARGVEAAHQKVVVHRDLKPANVLFAADGTPKVADFGLAKKLDEVGQTTDGAVFGTPAYMAPEQAEGKEAGPACDVHALGVLLYECLTGRRPFDAPTPTQTTLRVIHDEPEPPRRWNRRVPPELQAVCLRCLRKDPRRRYGSAAEVADELRRWLEGRPTRERPPGLPARVMAAARRRPLTAALLLAVVLGTLVGLGAYWYNHPERWHEKHQRALASGKSAVLVGEKGQRSYSVWRQGADRSSLLATRDGAFTLDSKDFGRLELLRDPGSEHYLLRADIRHDASDSKPPSGVGLYFAAVEHAAGGRPVHAFLAVTYNDIRPAAEVWDRVFGGGKAAPGDGVPPRPTRSKVGFGPYLYEERGEEDAWDDRIAPLQVELFKPAGEHKPVWRTLEAEMTPRGVRVWFRDDPAAERQFVGTLTDAKINEYFGEGVQGQKRRQPDDRSLDGLEPRFRPRGSLGLLVRFGTATFRNVVVEPRTPGP
jgi:serine/threonine-protein kinase